MSRELDRTDLRIAIGLAVAFVVFALASTFVVSACGSFHDDAIYLSSAKSLAEGSGYRLINMPGSPPQTKYPFLYPLLLAFLWKIWPEFPANLWLMQGFTLATAAMAIGLAYLFLVRFDYASRWVAFGSVALTVTTPFLDFISTRVLSEMPFALLLVCALWRIERDIRRPPGPWTSQLLTGILIALPYLCRSVGVALIAAALLVLVVRRRPLVMTLLGISVSAGPWIYWSLTALGQWQHNSIVGYYTDYMGSWSVLGTDPAGIIGWNLIFLFVSTIGISLVGVSMGATWLFDWQLAPIFLLAGTIPWLVVFWRAKHFDPLPLLLILYGLLLVVWPWPPARFLLPILPFILAFAGRAVVAVLRAALPSFQRQVIWVSLSLVLVANLMAMARIGALVRTTGFPFFSFPDTTVTWSDYEDVLSWLRDNTDPTDTVASALDSMVFLYTQRQSIRPFPYRPDRFFYGVPGPKGRTASELLEVLTASRARYLTMFPVPGFVEEVAVGQEIAELRRAFPDRLVPVFVGRDPRFAVFEVR